MRFALAFAFASVSLLTAALIHPMGRTSDRASIELTLNHQLDSSLHKRLARLMDQQTVWVDEAQPLDRTTLTRR
jgi:hypothetical protein